MRASFILIPIVSESFFKNKFARAHKNRAGEYPARRVKLL
jgi:hypothetical protein